MLAPSDEVCDWLADNSRSLVSIEQIGGYHCYATGDYVKRGVGFNFSEPADALLFKLTWGGA